MSSTNLPAQVRLAGYCSRPVRLRGHTDAVDTLTGELATLIDSAGLPGGALLVPCGNRRATACPACSRTYRGDAWHLIAAGLQGGKGVDQQVARHPCLFVTLTAPSFGAVHSARVNHSRRRRCRHRRGVCSHGLPLGCTKKHSLDDPLLGQPFCPECFDYRRAVLWNSRSSQLWDRTLICLRRDLAARLRIKAASFPDIATLSYVKVVEYQARGLVHFHAVLRLDGSRACLHPAPVLGELDFADAVRESARAVSLTSDFDGQPMHWGSQVDVRLVRRGEDTPQKSAIAGYIAKYATKSTDASGALDRRIRTRRDIDHLAVNAHLRQMVLTCWELGADPALRHLRLRGWAHSLGFRGHWTTKSRYYSTTFAALREARRCHNANQTGDPAFENTLGHWSFDGRGYFLEDNGDPR